METKITKLPKSEAEIIVELSEEEFSKFSSKAKEQIYSSIEIPGFRKGKAPEEMMKKKVSDKEIFQEAAKNAIEETLEQALDKEKVEVLGMPKIDIQAVDLSKKFVYKIQVTLLPQVKIANLKKIETQRKKVEVKDEEIEKVIKDLKTSRKKEIISEKPAIKGNKVTIDIEMFSGLVPLEGGQAKNIPYILGEKSWLPDLEKNLTGVKRGEIKEFVITYPADFYDKKLASKDINFKVKVNEVYEIELPELNDEFIKSLGDFKDVEDFKNKIKLNLELEKKQKNEESLELEILTKLVEQSEFEEIPEILLEEESHKMLHELEDNLVQQNMKFEDYLNHLKKTKEGLEKEFRPQAEKRIKTILIIRNLIKENNLMVVDTELNEEIKKLSDYYHHQPELQKNFQTPEYRDYLRNMMLNRKAIEFIKNQVKIIE